MVTVNVILVFFQACEWTIKKPQRKYIHVRMIMGAELISPHMQLTNMNLQVDFDYIVLIMVMEYLPSFVA